MEINSKEAMSSCKETSQHNQSTGLKPIEPVATSNQSNPSLQVKPIEPVKPFQEVKPIEPVKPFQEVKPIEPVKPTTLSLKYNDVNCMDCVEGVKMMPSCSVDLVVTSPPYGCLRDYKGFSWDFEALARELFRVMRDGGVVVWVVNDSVIEGSESGSSFSQALFFKQVGFRLHDTMIYKKNMTPLNSDPTRYVQEFEYMFVLSKGRPKTFNPIMRKNKLAGQLNDMKHRTKEGEVVAKDKQMIGEFSVHGNIFDYNVGGFQTTSDKFAFEHPAAFPEKLAEDQIKTWSNEGDLILDPFSGSATTLKMAKLNNRKFIGFEISPEYCEICRKRIMQSSILMFLK